jgi:hypothetical protein
LAYPRLNTTDVQDPVQDFRRADPLSKESNVLSKKIHYSIINSESEEAKRITVTVCELCTVQAVSSGDEW